MAPATYEPLPPFGRWVAYAAVAATYLLIVMGGVVRATGSGLGCPDWPLCYGQLVPPSLPPAVIEFTHRLMGGVVSLLVVGTALLTWRARRADRYLAAIAVATPLLLVAQILLGAVTVWLELPPLVVLAHLALAMLLLGLLIVMAAGQGPGAGGQGPGDWQRPSPLLVSLDATNKEMPSLAPGPRPPTPAAPAPGPRPPTPAFRRLAGAAVVAVFLLVLTGGFVRASGASWACLGFPTCNGEILPLGASRLVDIHLLHRFLAFAVAGHLAVLIARAWRSERTVPGMAPAAAVLGGCLLAQLAIGAYAVSKPIQPVAQVLHVAGAAALWAATVALAARAWGLGVRGQGPGARDQGPGTALFDDSSTRSQEVSSDFAGPPTPGLRPLAPTVRSTVAAYLSLTKPRIIVLLLITTLGAMLLAAGGFPPLHVVVLTLIGGALGAGGANAINCWLDRDIDSLMSRTASRAIPSGAVAPWHALAFGLTLGAGSFVLLAVFVNVLAAALTAAALAFYVLVYTLWLKRSSEHNIVIGGAAGAVPPLVGWAAVTGEVSLLALALFAIIFLWTPPHFWALSLLLTGEYAQARIPMLPVVRGEQETRRQILLYSVLMVAFTLLIFSLGLLGPLYFVVALALGGCFVALALRLMREATQRAARRLFRYSIAYLALLFVAMVADRGAGGWGLGTGG